jgi:hypothetical protein
LIGNGVLSVIPPVHVYEPPTPAPSPARVIVEPIQVSNVDGLAVTTGNAFTVNEVVVVPVHPFASVTDTVYVNDPVVAGVAFVVAFEGLAMAAGPVHATVGAD